MPHPENIENHKYQAGDERAVINGSKGGNAARATKQRKRDLRLALEVLLEKDYPVKIDGKDTTRSGAETLASILMNKAVKGDLKAFELVRDTAGQKPIERMVIADVDAETLADVERLVEGIGDE